MEAARRQAENIQRQEQERLQREQEAARRRSERVEGADTQLFKPKIEVPGIGAPCRDIREIAIDGAPNLSDSVQKSINQDFTGRCLNVSDIENILSKITKDYIDRGYITARAYLSSQDLSKGRLHILVVEGVVSQILIDDGNTKSVSVSNIFPGIVGGLLNLRDLEQGIDQINRLPSNNAQLDIQPGNKPGASVVVVKNQPSFPLHLYVTSDNQGTESTGKNQAGATVSADNPLGFNESLSITHRTAVPNDTDHKSSTSDSLNFSIPFGYNTLSVGTSYSRYVSTVVLASGTEMKASGNSKTNNVRFDRVMYRDQSSRATLAATVTTKATENFLNDQFLAVSSRNLSVLDLDGNFSTGVLGGTFSADLGYARGLSSFGALQDPDNLLDSLPHAQFGKIKAGFNFLIPFKVLSNDLSFTTQLTAQRALNTLYGSEQISIGGIFSVRGFERNTLSGDSGFYLRNEIAVRKPLDLGAEPINSRLYAAYDIGSVTNRAPGIPEGRLTGMAVGISMNWRKFSFDIFYSSPLTMPSSMAREGGQTWFRLSYSI